MRLGFHVDWASGFPFESIGLPDNYAAALPSVWAFGFDYDSDYTRRAGEGLRTGILLAEGMLTQRAAATGLSSATYKSRLRRRYRELLKGPPARTTRNRSEPFFLHNRRGDAYI
jgi:hypothetical protein